jgi:hypothetical protein
MSDFQSLKDALRKKHWNRFAGLSTPAKIQAFPDGIPYSGENVYCCPSSALRDRKGHCYDGAVFAAAALRRLGHPPLIIDMLADNDDDHLLALYKRDGHWGAVAKSNFAGLRFREPIYRTLRERVMSYFEDFFNLRREKTLRSYTVPLNLKAFDQLDWLIDDAAMDAIAGRLDEIRKVPLLISGMIDRLSPIDRRSYLAGMLGLNRAGVYKPPRKRS